MNTVNISEYKKIAVDELYYNENIFEKITGNKVTGKYIDVKEDVGKYHQNLYFIESLDSDKKITKLFGYSSLDRQMKLVNIGEIVEVEYIRYNSNKNYHEYKVSKLIKNE